MGKINVGGGVVPPVNIKNTSIRANYTNSVVEKGEKLYAPFTREVDFTVPGIYPKRLFGIGSNGMASEAAVTTKMLLLDENAESVTCLLAAPCFSRPDINNASGFIKFVVELKKFKKTLSEEFEVLSIDRKEFDAIANVSINFGLIKLDASTVLITYPTANNMLSVNVFSYTETSLTSLYNSEISLTDARYTSVGLISSQTQGNVTHFYLALVSSDMSQVRFRAMIVSKNNGVYSASINSTVVATRSGRNPVVKALFTNEVLCVANNNMCRIRRASSTFGDNNINVGTNRSLGLAMSADINYHFERLTESKGLVVFRGSSAFCAVIFELGATDDITLYTQYTSSVTISSQIMGIIVVGSRCYWLLRRFGSSGIMDVYSFTFNLSTNTITYGGVTNFKQHQCSAYDFIPLYTHSAYGVGFVYGPGADCFLMSFDPEFHNPTLMLVPPDPISYPALEEMMDWRDLSEYAALHAAIPIDQNRTLYIGTIPTTHEIVVRLKTTLKSGVIVTSQSTTVAARCNLGVPNVIADVVSINETTGEIKIGCAFVDTNDSSKPKVVLITVTGNSFVVSSILTLNTTNTLGVLLKPLSTGTHFLVLYLNSNKPTAAVISISGTSISVSASGQCLTPAVTSLTLGIAAAAIREGSPNTCLLFFMVSTTINWLQFTFTTTTVTAQSTAQTSLGITSGTLYGGHLVYHSTRNIFYFILGANDGMHRLRQYTLSGSTLTLLNTITLTVYISSTRCFMRLIHVNTKPFLLISCGPLILVYELSDYNNNAALLRMYRVRQDVSSILHVPYSYDSFPLILCILNDSDSYITTLISTTQRVMAIAKNECSTFGAPVLTL